MAARADHPAARDGQRAPALAGGVSPDAATRGVAVILGALAEHGPLARAALLGHLKRAGVPTAGQAFVHLMVRATIQGLIVRGPLIDQEQRFVLVRDWLDEPLALDRETALVELGDGLLDLPDRVTPAGFPGPRLLGPFDPLLHGWHRRDWVLDHPGHVVTSNGIFRRSILLGDRIAGTWTHGGDLHPFAALPLLAAVALHAELTDGARFLG